MLDINSVEDDKHILSLSSGGKVFEYLLTKRVLFRVHDAEGNDWLPTAEVIIRRTYTYSDTEALAKEYEEQRLWREMQTDAVQQIVRRLQAAKKPDSVTAADAARPSANSPAISPKASRRCMSCTATSRCWRSRPAT